MLVNGNKFAILFYPRNVLLNYQICNVACVDVKIIFKLCDMFKLCQEIYEIFRISCTHFLNSSFFTLKKYKKFKKILLLLVI